MLLFAVFLLVVLLLVGSIHWYLWRRLVRDTTRPGRWRRVGTFVLLGLTLLIPAALLGRPLPLAQQRWLAWPGYLWLATMFLLLTTLLVLEVPRLAVTVATRGQRRTAAPATSVTPERVLAGVPAADGAAGTHRGAGTNGAAGTDRGGSTDREAGTNGGAGTDREGSTDREAGTNGGGGSDRGGTAPHGDEPPVTPVTPVAAGDEPDGEPADPSRRLLLARSLAIVAGLTAVGVTGYGVRSAMGPPVVTRRSIVLDKLPRQLDRLRIALVADIHVGPFLGRAHTERIVNLINRLDADLVAVVGDLVDGTVAELGAAAEPLARLQSRGGAYFVTGNHEYYSGHQEWIDELNSLGLRVLRNERVEVGGIDLAGVNDVAGAQYSDGPDYERAMDGRDPAKAVVLLAHQPIQVHEAQRHGVDLQLSGHTHGGQIFPFGYLIRLQQPLIAGYARFGGTQLYVTNGAGFWGPPVRVGAPPDITLIELRSP